MRTTLAVLFVGILGLGAVSASAAEAKLETIAALYQNKSTLAGKEVRVRGKVVKVNNNIMGRNFLHLRDGTGDKDTNDLTVTSNETAAAGDQVTVTWRVGINKDFGSGYSYALLLEEAKVTAKK